MSELLPLNDPRWSEYRGGYNRAVADEIRESYNAAIRKLPQIALRRGQEAWDDYCFEPVMACLALSLGHRQHARAYLDLTESEIPEFYKYYYGE